MTATPPVVTSLTADKPSYAKGETITVTMAYQAGTSDADVSALLTGQVTDQVTGLSGQMSMTLLLLASSIDKTQADMASVPALAWQLVSDQNGIAVFKAVYQ